VAASLLGCIGMLLNPAADCATATTKSPLTCLVPQGWKKSDGFAANQVQQKAARDTGSIFHCDASKKE
jgi:hypothetical protein